MEIKVVRKECADAICGGAHNCEKPAHMYYAEGYRSASGEDYYVLACEEHGPPWVLGLIKHGELVNTPEPPKVARTYATEPPPGSWAETARMMAGLFPDDGIDWDRWKDEMKDREMEGEDF